MVDRLVEIERKDWPVLKELYKPDGKKSYVAYITIDTYIRWFEQDPELKHVTFFCLNGDFSDGTFVVTDRSTAYVDTFNASDENVFRLVSLLDFTKGYFFLNIRSDIQQAIVKAAENAGTEVLLNDHTLLYQCPKEIALNFDVLPPDGIELHPIIKRSDIEKVKMAWPQEHRNPDSVGMLERIAKCNANIGAFKGDGNAVAWILRYSTGLLCALQTDKDHFGYGYGTLVTKYISKKIAELDHDVYAGILENNIPSRKLFEKLGFKEIGRVYWISTKFEKKCFCSSKK